MVSEPKIRKIYSLVEETHADGVKRLDRPVRKSAVAIVFKNPFVDTYQEDLSLLYQWSEELGENAIKKAISALAIEADKVESYGKAAIVGERGELEHCAAILHPKLGIPLRGNVGPAKALIPSAKKLGCPGTAIDVPLHYKNAAYVRSHFDAMEVRVPDAPKSDELVLIVAITDGGRPFPRIGGLKVEEVKGEDGLK
ncbi:MAG TPA: amino acid synthesis family protein [Desulfotomaculum sp.]|nr:MAG: peptide synthetase [Desulfotomaculum sp. BICA1-6]HBX24211.1 amino acid synthesis family protein [Desulfotomaculum sp.]